MKLPKFVQPHTVDVQEYNGDTTYGPDYSDSYEVEGYFQNTRKYIRDDEGDEVVSESQFYTSEDIDLPKKSIVTFDGIDHEVITTSRKTNALIGKLTHVEVALE